MRFITEFETNDEKYVDGIRKIHKEENLGHEMADKIGWKEAGFITTEGLATIRYSLEIEAFPMDKWVEFRKRFLAALPDYDNTSRIRLEHALHDLESFGKPSGENIKPG